MSGLGSSSALSLDAAAPLRRAELLAALSLATDLGMGQPLGNGQRTAILAVRLGAAAGLDARDLKDCYYVGFLRHVGCTADAPVTAEMFGGDEIVGRGWMALVDQGRPSALMATLIRRVGAAESPLRRARMVAKALLKMSRLQATTEASREVAQALADELGCAVRVRQALGHAFERWDGKGIPKRLKGDAIALAARVVRLADDAQAFQRAVGRQATLAMLDARAGLAHDPALSKVMRAQAPELLGSLDAESIWDAAIAAEPGPPDYIADEEVDLALRALGAFADLKCSYTRGHSAAVAELAATAGERLGLGPEQVTEIRRAGYLHDVGRAGVPAGIWEKHGALSDREWEQVRMHSSYTERILARPPLLARLGALGALDHERVDGSGYRRLLAGALPTGARLLAVADMVQAMRADRPHRRALAPSVVAEVLDKEVAAGRLDPEAVRAVLEAAGNPASRPDVDHPGGLSDGELEVLRLVASGLEDKQVGRTLGFSTRAVDHHLQQVYDKIGVTTRAAAAMFAMRHGLVGRDDGEATA